MAPKLTLESDDLTATVEPLGARLSSVRYRVSSNLLLDTDPEVFPGWQEEYCSVLVGPIANRVRAGHVRIGGKTFQMPCNEDDTNSLHSGPHGLHTRTWDTLDLTRHSVRFGCLLNDGECGLPGIRHVSASYAVKGPLLTLDIDVTTTEPTPVSIAHHPYWRLGPSASHTLRVIAERYLPVDAQKLPTGEIYDVTGTEFDFRHPRPIPAWIDHNLCIRDSRLPEPVPVAELTNADGMRLRIETTEPGLQVYAGAHLPDLPESIMGPGAGIALEPQGWPDAINRAHFPTVLHTPDNPYRQVTRYRFDRIK